MPETLGTELVVRRLLVLETAGTEAKTVDAWKATLSDMLKVPIESESDWACDPKLFEFFRGEALIAGGNRLSDACRKGFW